MKILTTALALAAAMLALAPGRAAADPAAIFVSDYSFLTGNVHGYTATGPSSTTRRSARSRAEGPRAARSMSPARR